MRDDAGTLVDIKLEEFWIVLLGMLTFSVDADVFSAFRRRDVLLGASKQLEREREVGLPRGYGHFMLQQVKALLLEGALVFVSCYPLSNCSDMFRLSYDSRFYR